MNIMDQTLTKKYKIGKYQYNPLHVIGIGHYGKVYKGFRLTDQKQVAIKTVDLVEHPDKQEAEFIQNELKIHQMLKHQRIVDCLDIYRKGDIYYFITEYLEEGDLEMFIKQNGPLDEQEALRLFKQLVQGLSYLKQKKVIHRDIKPANIFIRQGNIKIADFGLSVLSYTEKFTHQLRIGTPRYMAPQVIRQGIYTFKCDIWSLGNLFIEMVTGQPPLAYCQTFEQLVQKIIEPIIPFDLNLSESSMDMLNSIFEINESKRICIEDLNTHLISCPLKKQISVLTNDTDDFLQIEQLSVSSKNRSRISSISTSYYSIDDEFQNNSNKQEECQVMRLFEVFMKSISVKDFHYNKFNSMHRKITEGRKMDTFQRFYLIEGVNRRLNLLQSLTDLESQMESIDLTQFKNILQ